MPDEFPPRLLTEHAALVTKMLESRLTVKEARRLEQLMVQLGVIESEFPSTVAARASVRVKRKALTNIRLELEAIIKQRSG